MGPMTLRESSKRSTKMLMGSSLGMSSKDDGQGQRGEWVARRSAGRLLCHNGPRQGWDGRHQGGRAFLWRNRKNGSAVRRQRGALSHHPFCNWLLLNLTEKDATVVYHLGPSSFSVLYKIRIHMNTVH